MDCNLPGSSVLGILQARILEWVAFPFSRESSQHRDHSGLPHGRQMLYQLSNKESPRILEWGEQKSWPKLIIQKTKIMASSPITSWQIHRETMVTVTHLIFLVSKITADGDCSHEHKRHLLLGRKAMRNLDSILKSRDITLPTRVCIFKAMVLSSSHVWIWELANP